MNFLKLYIDYKYFVYDGISSEIFELENCVDYNNINYSDLGHTSELRDLSSLEKIISSGKKITDDAKTLVIEITYSCNMRCKYCIFDDTNNEERNHSINTINYDIAIKHIDDFAVRATGKPVIVFYGGEPLIASGIIAELINYTNSRYCNIFNFSITTNAILLSDKLVNLVIDNNISLTISYDGPSHDKID